MAFVVFWSFSLGSRPALLPSGPYFRVSVLVAVFQSTETSLYMWSERTWSVEHVVNGTSFVTGCSYVGPVAHVFPSFALML